VAIESSAREAAERQLLDVLKERVGEVEGLLELFESVEEDGVYRYYHQSLKVYSLQGAIRRAQRLFDELAPTGTELNAWLVVICQDACAHQFDLGRSNSHWQEETRPILEAFWHCRYFLRQLARYGRELDEPSRVMPYGWAAVLYLYNIR
jgi:hypothetical protein